MEVFGWGLVFVIRVAICRVSGCETGSWVGIVVLMRQWDFQGSSSRLGG